MNQTSHLKSKVSPKQKQGRLSNKSMDNSFLEMPTQQEELTNRSDQSILSPPTVIPESLKATSNKSDSVWFVEAPENLVLSEGRALRVTCKIYAQATVGEDDSFWHNLFLSLV